MNQSETSGYGAFDPDQMQGPEYEECPECDGSGYFEDLSECCGDTRDPDTGLCHYCHDHCGPTECEDCHGTGILNQ